MANILVDIFESEELIGALKGGDTMIKITYIPKDTVPKSRSRHWLDRLGIEGTWFSFIEQIPDGKAVKFEGIESADDLTHLRQSIQGAMRTKRYVQRGFTFKLITQKPSLSGTDWELYLRVAKIK